jgi:hypothetical protein
VLLKLLVNTPKSARVTALIVRTQHRQNIACRKLDALVQGFVIAVHVVRSVGIFRRNFIDYFIALPDQAANSGIFDCWMFGVAILDYNFKVPVSLN